MLGLLLAAAAGWAQTPTPPPAYAVVGARVEIGDGTVLEKGTVLIRDGLIQAVGPDVAVPPEAEVVPGEGLTVYPGFVDGLNSQGLTLPPAVPQQDTPPDLGADAPAFMREANRSGIRPELRAADHLALTDAQLIPMRQAGFTTALIAPTGGILDGVGALVNLGGQPRREAVVLSRAGMHAGFRTTRGSYPGSLLGVFSHFRQALLDAQRYGLLQSRFETGGGRRPAADETLAALQPVLRGEIPVIWDADNPNEIRQAIALSDEFRFKLIISGGAEAWKVAPLLKERQIPVLVALNFPPEPRMRTPMPASGEQPAEEDEPEAVRQDRKRQRDERVANAVRLREAGVRFAFTTRGTRNPAEFTANLRRATQAGLPKEAALQALTRDAAALLGAERQMGTLTPGKIANLTVLSAAFTEPTARALWMFIDGRKFQPEKERAPNTPAAPMGGAQPSAEDLEELLGHGHPHR